MSKQWTTRQIEIIHEYARFGAQQISDEIARQTGVRRSVTAVQIQASRQGISLKSYALCPSCGRQVLKLERSGFCAVCDLKRRTTRIKAECGKLESERAAEEAAARREYNAAKQRLYRLRKNEKK